MEDLDLIVIPQEPVSSFFCVLRHPELLDTRRPSVGSVASPVHGLTYVLSRSLGFGQQANAGFGASSNNTGGGLFGGSPNTGFGSGGTFHSGISPDLGWFVPPYNPDTHAPSDLPWGKGCPASRSDMCILSSTSKRDLVNACLLPYRTSLQDQSRPLDCLSFPAILSHISLLVIYVALLLDLPFGPTERHYSQTLLTLC